jgi:hypothetical protein
LDGEILEDIEVIDILRQNDLYGLLFMSSLHNSNTLVRGDTLHLNDIEVFPSSLRPGTFAPGDIMLSLRNINTVMVIDHDTHEVKFRATGRFLRQHDPDFVDGDRITIFDNRNLSPSRGPEKRASRVVELDARTGEMSVVLDGRQETPFFTDIMGTHQRLPNGNLLITSSREGRIIEVLPDGSVAWEFQNRVDEHRNGLVTMGMVLPPEMDEAFFRRLAAPCN